eukprot:3521433-Alexandrium_andersonii.AAC.1
MQLPLSCRSIVMQLPLSCRSGEWKRQPMCKWRTRCVDTGAPEQAKTSKSHTHDPRQIESMSVLRPSQKHSNTQCLLLGGDYRWQRRRRGEEWWRQWWRQVAPMVARDVTTVVASGGDSGAKRWRQRCQELATMDRKPSQNTRWQL